MTVLIAVLCATASSHAHAGVASAQPLLHLLQPLIAELSSTSVSSGIVESPQTKAQLNIVRCVRLCTCMRTRTRTNMHHRGRDKNSCAI